MNKFFLLALAVLSFVAAGAQMPGGMGGGANRGGRAQMNVGHFYGKVVDAKTNKGIDAASVQLVLNRGGKDSIISGMLTKSNGDFSLENLPIFGNFRLKITAIGYTAVEQKVAFDIKMGAGQQQGGQGGQGDMSQALAAIDKDLGNIKLAEDAKVLESVTVSASKPLIQMGIDRKIFNVEKNINSAGGTAVDIMRTIPSVNVDVDGNVTLRNSAPQIFVDGRPTTLTLDQIPSDAIQSIELITNPSAKYDASGGQAGILNVVLKKNRKAGYNGTVRLGIDSRARLNGGGDINIRQGKVNVFANANFNQRKSKSWGETDRTTFGETTSTLMNQYNNNVNKGSFAFGRLGADYFIDNRNTITLSGSLVNGNFNFNNRTNSIIDTLESGYGMEGQYRNTGGKFEFRNYGAQLSYKHTFAKPNQEWTADVNFNSSKNNNSSDIYSRSFYDAALLDPKYPEAVQTVKSNGGNKFLVVQTDYVHPISDNMKWEAGLRAQTRTFNSEQLNYYNGILNPNVSSNYEYTDYIYAGYATFSQKIKDKYSYQLGLRAESSKYDGEQLGSQKFKNSFPLSLFPSVFVTRTFENKQDIQLNYSRRINRPNFFQLMPNVDYSDTLNYQTGNPNLKPEFTNSLELSYQKTYGKRNNTFLATVFGKYTTDLIARYQSRRLLDVTKDSVFVSSYINASTAYAAGIELVFRNNLTKWWEATLSGNVYYSKINGTDIPDVGNIENERTSWTAKMNNAFKFSKGWSVQLSGEYQSRSALPVSTSNSGGGGGRGGGGGFMGGGPSSTTQGYIDANYGVDLGLRKDFQIKTNTLTLSANWSDIFRTRRMRSHSVATGFIQDSWTRRDPQMVRVNLSYRFGKFDLSLFKRKNSRGEAEGMQNGMQGMQQ
ncbi:MAG: outer membrane beta-barrel family protein [Chitinophagaceae bacterium]